jgi:hypothetical protein
VTEAEQLASVLETFPTAVPESEPTPILMEAFAHAYARAGLPVFPIQPRGKQPLTAHGFHDASTFPKVITAWWKQWPKANVGIRTGEEAGVVVLDVDGPEGEESLRKLPQEIPPTWIASTGKGAHLYFAHPGEKASNSVRKLGPGLDVRGDGGYVVAPPSIHPSGEVYTWLGERRTLAPWPEWLKPAPRPKPTAKPARKVASMSAYVLAAVNGEAAALAAMPAGGRNDKLNAATYSLRTRFVDTGELSATALAEAMYEAALASGLEDLETRRTIRSAMRAP